MKIVLVSIMLAACGADVPPVPDAATCAPTNGCCDLLPDVHAVAVCAANPAAPCGELLCYAADCSRTVVDTCGL